MTFNGFGTQAAWPDGTGFSASDFGDISKGGTSIRDLCQGMNNCVCANLSLTFYQQTDPLTFFSFEVMLFFILFIF